MTVDPNKNGWQFLEYKNPARLYDTVQQLHHAIQFIAMADLYLPPVHVGSDCIGITWDLEREAYIGKVVEAEEPFRVALKAGTFDLLLFDENLNEKAKLHLPGDTKGYVYSWMKENIAGCCEEWGRLRPVMPYKLPENPIDKGKPFRIADPLALKELTRYRNNAHRVFLEIGKVYETVSETGICPDDFNTTCLLAISEKEGKPARGIMMGLSLGDKGVNEPYFYYEKAGDTISGRNILKASDLTGIDSAADQYSKVMEFYDQLY